MAIGKVECCSLAISLSTSQCTVLLLQGNVEVGEQLLRLGADPNEEVKVDACTSFSPSSFISNAFSKPIETQGHEAYACLALIYKLNFVKHILPRKLA